MKLLVNAKIFSSKKSQSILIQNEKIIFIGDSKDINISCESLEIIDCENNSVLPGFIDGHCHPFETISNLSSIDLSKESFRSKKDICNFFKNIKFNKDIKLLKFHGFEHRYINSDLTLKFFDDLNINIPLIIKHRTGHIMFTNSLAIKYADLNTKELKYPINSIEIHKKFSDLSSEDFNNNTKIYNRNLIKFGYTTIVDAGASNDISKFNKYKELKSEKYLSPNICYMVGSNHINEFRNINNKKELFIGPIKFMINECFDIGEIESLLKECLSNSKNDVAFHAISSEMIFKIIHILYEKLPNYLSNRNIRLEHATEFIPEFYLKYKSKNLFLIYNPNFIYDHGDFYIDNQDEFEVSKLFNLAESVKKGFNIGLGTDAPFGNYNPFRMIYTALNRITKNNNIIQSETKINIEDILKAYSLNNAKAINTDDTTGSISIGKNADLIILNNDINNLCDDSEILNTKVIHTIINGTSEYVSSKVN